MAAFGPALDTVMVNVTNEPANGVALLTVLARLRSETCGNTGSLSESSSLLLSTLPSFGFMSTVPINPSLSGSGPLSGVESGSYWSESVTSATLLYVTPAVGANTVAWKESTTLPPDATFKLLQVIVDPTKVPPPVIFAILL